MDALTFLASTEPTSTTTDSVRAWITAVAGIAAFLPLMFWLFERKERRQAEERLRRSQIRAVYFHEVETDKRPEVRTWRVDNHSNAPLPFVTLECTMVEPSNGISNLQAGFGSIGPNAAKVRPLPRELTGPIKEARLYVRDVDGNTWNVDENGTITPARRPRGPWARRWHTARTRLSQQLPRRNKPTRENDPTSPDAPPGTPPA